MLGNLKVFKRKRNGGIEVYGVVSGKDDRMIQLLAFSNYKCELTVERVTLSDDDVFELIENTKKYAD